MDWKKLKREYITTNTSYRKLADKYGVPFGTLRKVALKENWRGLRAEYGTKADTKFIESEAAKQAERVSKINIAADMLLDKIMRTLEVMDDDSLDTGAYRQISATIKDVKDIYMIRSDADLREQEARIEKLRRDADKGDDGDSTVRVVIEGSLNDYSG